MATESDELDEEFDKFLVEMKPFVLQLPHKSERQRCALWIKKLCEPTGHGTTGRKNRNMYAKLLLHMLKKALIEGPFSHKPDPGPLPTLPDYMSIYFDEPTHTKSPPLREEGYRSLPDWVDTELVGSGSRSNPSRSSRTRQRLFDSDMTKSSPDHTRGNSLGIYKRKSSNLNLTSSSSSSTSSDDHRVHTPKDKTSPPQTSSLRPVSRQAVSSQPPVTTSAASLDLPRANKKEERRSWRKTDKHRLSTDTKRVQVVHSDETTERRAEVVSGNSIAYRGLAKFNEESAQIEREIELRTKILEARFHEEKLLTQQRHDEAVQKILDRKNAEIEEMKSHYRTKTKDLEETNKILERKVESSSQDVSSIKDTKDKQIKDLKRMLDQTSQTAQNHFEKKLQEALADIEQEKFDMQKEHTKGIQDILEDTNSRLQTMEAEYSDQIEKHALVIKKLESRIHHLTSESEKQLNAQERLRQDKIDLERLTTTLKTELENMNEKYATLGKTLDQQRKDSDRETRSLKSRYEATLEISKNEHATALRKSAEKLQSAERQVQELRQSLQESEMNRQRQVRETEAELKQDRVHQENLHEKKLRSLQTEMEQERQDSKKRQEHQEQVIQSKDGEIAKLKELIKLQTQQSERTLADFKAQVERNSTKMFDDMKLQMAKVEADLTRSKELREKQSQEFTRQRQEDKKKFEKQLNVLHESHKQEKASLTKHLQTEQEAQQTNHHEQMNALREQYERKLVEIEGSMHEQRSKDNMKISELQETASHLKQELHDSEALRKQEVVQLGLLKAEERQTLVREHEIEINRLQSEKEQQRLRLQKEHSASMEKTMQETNQRLKKIENDYKAKLEDSSVHQRKLQATIENLKEKEENTRSNMELQLSETVTQMEKEKNVQRKQQAEVTKTLKQQIDSLKDQGHKLETRLRSQEFSHREKLTQVKMDYESRMRGLLPISVRQQLEDTISSLKSQVHSLQQRTMLLQEEIDVSKGLPSTSLITSSPVLKGL